MMVSPQGKHGNEMIDFFGAEDRNRTDMISLSRDFESRASACSATSASTSQIVTYDQQSSRKILPPQPFP